MCAVGINHARSVATNVSHPSNVILCLLILCRWPGLEGTDGTAMLLHDLAGLANSKKVFFFVENCFEGSSSNIFDLLLLRYENTCVPLHSLLAECNDAHKVCCDIAFGIVRPVDNIAYTNLLVRLYS